MANSIIENSMKTDMLSEYALFQKDPMAYLVSKGLNIPQDVLSKGPQASVEYIISSGMGSNEQLQQFQTMLNMFRK